MHTNTAVDRAGTDASARSWLCESAAERERMLDMETRIRPVRAVTMGALALGLLASGPWIGFWTLIPLAAAAGGFAAADRLGRGARYPEYAMMAAWVTSQVAIGVGVALTGGPESPALLLMMIPVVSLSARFPLRGVVAGVCVTLGIMALATFAAEPSGLLDYPPLTILAAVGVVSVGVLSTALLRSDMYHRSEAVLDQLTGMLNRKALATRAAELEQQSKLVDQPIGLIVGDIDHFKTVNDRHGHTTGDAVLKDVAYLLRKQLRAFDLAYRIGGEEFLLLLPGAGVERTAELAEDLRQTIAGDTVAGGLRITMSFGVAGSSEGEAFDYEQAFANADAALLTAKREGRDRVCRHGAQPQPAGV